MVCSSIPSANQVATRVLPMVAVFLEVQCSISVDRNVFEHFKESAINQASAHSYLSAELGDCRIGYLVVPYRR